MFFKEVIIGQHPSPEDNRKLVELLWHSYAKKVFLFAYAKLENSEDARDTCQDTFVKAIEWLEKNPGHMPLNLNFPAWLRRIAGHLIIDRFRRPGLELYMSSEARVSQEETFLRSDWPDQRPCDPAEHIGKEEEIYALRECIKTLPERNRYMLTLCDLEGLSYKSITTQTGIPENTVGVILHRVRKKLRECMEIRLVS